MKIYAREAHSGTWTYHETDDEGWDIRKVSLKEDWTPYSAIGLAEVAPGCERDWGKVARMDVDEWLRQPDVELVAAEKFEEIWALARGALGLPVEIRPYQRPSPEVERVPRTGVVKRRHSRLVTRIRTFLCR